MSDTTTTIVVVAAAVVAVYFLTRDRGATVVVAGGDDKDPPPVSQSPRGGFAGILDAVGDFGQRFGIASGSAPPSKATESYSVRGVYPVRAQNLEAAAATSRFFYGRK